MTKNEAKKEAKTLAQKIAETSAKNREQAAKNSEAMADGSAFVYGPIHSVNNEDVEVTFPNGIKGKTKMVVAKFDKEVKYCTDRKAGNDWVKAKCKEWTEKNGKMLSAKKLRVQIAKNVLRLDEVLKQAKGLPESVTAPLTIAFNKLSEACKAIPAPEKKEPKSKKSAA